MMMMSLTSWQQVVVMEFGNRTCSQQPVMDFLCTCSVEVIQQLTIKNFKSALSFGFFFRLTATQTDNYSQYSHHTSKS